MAGILTCVEDVKRRLKVDVLREAGRQYPLTCFVLVSMLALTVLLNRYIHILMVFWSLLAGFATFYCSLGPETLLPSVLFTVKPRSRRREQELFPLGHSCAVCGKVKCKRHRPTLLLENYQPWLDLKVHSKVDASVAEVFELVLENFVYPWYRDITDDEACLDELRMTFRFFASVLVRRAQKVDIPAVFADKVMKAAMKHIEIIAKAHQRGMHVDRSLCSYTTSCIAGVSGRVSDKFLSFGFCFMWCRSLALLLREVMAGSVILPTMDFMADPVSSHVIASVCIFGPEPATEPPSPLVPFLQKYEETHQVLKLELKEIREQQDLLFRFMNFLKQEGAVHVLQFCLAVEELNDKILRPELSDSELLHLHGEVVHMYETYCLEESIDKISFDPFIVEEIRNVAKGPYTEVVKLQQMRCLFEAYEHVLSLLERVFTPIFCHSDEYFRHLLKGAESPMKYSLIFRNTSKRGESFGIRGIGSKIKGVFKSTTMEGALLPPSAMTDVDEDTVEEATVVMEDDSPDEPAITPEPQRNLLAWSITIPYIDFYDDDDIKKERILVFSIHVERNDKKNADHEADKWLVYRKYMEFYVLESKLTEFHGPFEDAQLPSKRIIGPKNYEFLESKREEFEKYLQTLLQHPELSNSQLLVDFLSPHVEHQFLDRMLPDVNLGTSFNDSRGQNLERFLQSFVNSCESPKPKPSRPELTIVSPTAGNKKLFSNLFKNNANLSERKHNPNFFAEMFTVDGMYDYMMYVGRVVFRMPDWLHHILCAGRILLKSTFEAYMDQYMQLKLEQILQEHRMVSLITQLRDAVFCESSEERTAEAKQARAKQTFEEMMKYLPDFVVKCIGEESKYEGIQLLFDSFQQPLLNKQVNGCSPNPVVPKLFLPGPPFLQEKCSRPPTT
uniref:Sorting nexin 14 n=1 Tax=Oreochromis niloticus TaxID=8128 RepID=A0A669BCW4_ORENI